MASEKKIKPELNQSLEEDNNGAPDPNTKQRNEDADDSTSFDITSKPNMCKGISDKVEGFIEDSSVGGLVQGKYYILGAAVVDEYNSPAFVEIMESRKGDREKKFRTDKDIIDEVLTEISKLNPRLYLVTIKKSEGWIEKDFRNVHRNGLFILIDNIAKEECAKEINLEIDQTDRAKSGTIAFILNRVSEKRQKKITGEIRDSRQSFGIQTADYVIGSMHRRYNHGERRPFDLLKTRIKRSNPRKNVTKPRWNVEERK
ncbi:MAG: DUF3800 domain-containing protein [Methanomassiliicoccaceae archaeon]|nr:DUF3800 domain-containing protein [Methanomassiliicoccaceae archaeon]